MSRVSINAGLLQMIVNGLKRDFAEGKTIRGEWVEDIERDARPIEDAAAEPNRAVELSRDDVIRMAREAEATVFLSPYYIETLERFAALVTAAADTPWKAAVIDQLIISHILTAEHETDPRKALRDLLAFESDIAIDPRVSEAAARLVEQARAEEREACLRCYSPDDTATDWADKIRARGQK